MKAAVLIALNEPLSVLELQTPTLLAGQVLVEVHMSGLCGAQLQEIRGEKGNGKFLPHMMGHEGFGRVLSVGNGVSKVREGDFVTLHWRIGSGLMGAPAKFVTSDGLSVGAGPVTSLATHVVVSENRVTVLPPDTPAELGALLGCALTTAFGLVEKQLAIEFGARVAVIGCGGLGLSIVAALSVRGAGKIVAIDVRQDKAQLALKLGATEFADAVNSTVDIIIDTTGIARVVSEASKMLAPGGQLALLVNNAGDYAFSSGQLFAGNGMRIVPTQGGDSNPDRDIPRLASFLRERPELWRDLVTHRLGISRVNEAVELLKSGLAGRIMIETRVS